MADVTDDLRSVGIGRGITETISTTVSVPYEKNEVSRKFNAAPVGLVNKDTVYVEIFKGSHTYENLIKTGEIGINMVYDPVLFVESVFGDLTDEDYEIMDGYPFLKEAHVVLKFSVIRIEERKVSSRFFLNLLRKDIRKTDLVGINRGFNLLLELAILASRRKISDKYNDMYSVYSPIIRKCGDERVIDALKLLNKRMNGQKG